MVHGALRRKTFTSTRKPVRSISIYETNRVRYRDRKRSDSRRIEWTRKSRCSGDTFNDFNGSKNASKKPKCSPNKSAELAPRGLDDRDDDVHNSRTQVRLQWTTHSCGREDGFASRDADNGPYCGPDGPGIARSRSPMAERLGRALSRRVWLATSQNSMTGVCREQGIQRHRYRSE